MKEFQACSDACAAGASCPVHGCKQNLVGSCAEQAQPIAEKVGRISANVKDMVLRQEVMLYTDDYLPIGTPLYTAPPQRQPLTPEQIKKGFKAQNEQCSLLPRIEAFTAGVKFSEAAHGIKGET